jgi:Tfp pilus assembly protein PilF
MADRTRTRPWLVLGLAAATAAALGIGFLLWRGKTPPGGGGDGGLPPGLDAGTYREIVSAFYAGVAALDADASDRAKVKLAKAVELAPKEPATWADRGLLGIRLRNYEAASRDLERARELAPESGAVEGLLALLASQQGQTDAAIAHWKRAVALDPGDLKSLFSLAQEFERQGGPEAEAESRRLLGEILKARPDNLTVLLDLARQAAKAADAEALREVVSRLGKLAPAWSPRAREQFRLLEQAAGGANPRQATTRILVLRNVLVTDPAFRESLAEVQTPVGVIGEPIERFLTLPTPSPTPSAPDEGLAYRVEPVPHGGEEKKGAVIASWLGADGPTALFASDGREVRRVDRDGPALAFPGGPEGTPPSPDGLLAVDWNSDEAMDLVLTGAGGLRLFRQGEDGSFEDVTDAAKLEANARDAAAFGVWAIDIELDGDLDLVVGLMAGAPLVLRNQGDGTFGVFNPFERASDVRGFVWADLDRDGAPDVALLDGKGGLRIYANERAGRYRERPAPTDLGAISAIATGDLNGDGAVDLVALRSDGAIVRVSDAGEGRSWTVAEVARWSDRPEGDARLFVADLDNNGALDIVASAPSGSRLWLGEGPDKFRGLAAPVDLRALAVADLSGDGRLDLAGLSGQGQVARATGRGTKDYHWQTIRPKAAKAVGDGRINSYGIGGEVEVRSGLLVQTQVIAGPVVHFGLGEHEGADIARVVWPNGTVQAEFDTKADQAVLAEQRLKGSCPFVFADDGTGVKFVTDFLWRSPLGLRINAQDTAGVGQTEDWIKIAGDRLAPREGYYDVRITAELWETHFWDHVSLMVVDHPAGTEVFVDERFARRPPELKVHPTGPTRPVARARDDRGQDVTEFVRSRDGRYLDTFGRGPYQGVTRDHWVEVELGDDVPEGGPLRLVAHGWIHPTDSSINVALGQGRHDPPQGLVLEVPTGDGGWAVARPDLGFPAGKDKTILVELDGLFPPGKPRKFRLRTNLEIFWDALTVTSAEEGTPLETQRIAPSSAELRLRGYSLIASADAASPERPGYDRLLGTGQRWRDLIGHYTRFGDVRELLEGVDDRYVIANAGDELALLFPAPGSPREGWTRDFVLIGDGWNKDGDYNTAFSKTVLPLPSHDRPAYDTPPGDLQDDPVYRAHPGDWDEYHTRYVTPRDFLRGLRPLAEESPSRAGADR